jgi:hypothetical protein
MAEYAPGVGSFQSLTQKPTSGEPPDGELDGDDAGDHGREGDRGAAVAHQQQHVLNFLRDKFTAETLYLWMQKETAALYRQIYDMAAFSASGGESVQSRTRP